MSIRTAERVYPAKRSVLVDVRRFVAEEAGRHSFAEHVPDLQLAVTEAVANAVVHSGTDEVRVSIAVFGSCIQITVEDDGVYQDVIPMPESDGVGHRGLHLMAALVDDLSLQRGTDRHGTVVRLVKCKA